MLSVIVIVFTVFLCKCLCIRYSFSGAPLAALAALAKLTSATFIYPKVAESVKFCSANRNFWRVQPLEVTGFKEFRKILFLTENVPFGYMRVEETMRRTDATGDFD